MEAVEVVRQVPYLAIAHSDAGSKFAYSPPMNQNTTKFKDDVSRTFTGPRTVLSLLSTATASQGKILSIAAPYNHSSYSIGFYGPIVQCETANRSTVILIDNFLDEMMAEPMGTAKAAESAYFAFVPARNASGNLIALSEQRLQEPSNATNELWFTFERFVVDAAGSKDTTRLHQVCYLYNSTYGLQLEWDKGIQNIKGSYQVREKIWFPQDKLGDVSNLAQHAYSALFWSITDQVVGSFTWYQETETPSPWRPAQFGGIDSAIAHNSLLGSSDLDVFFWLDEKYRLYKDDNETILSSQRLQDKALARNRTLDVLIEELSFNTTVSLLQNGLLTLAISHRFSFSPSWAIY